MTEQKTGTELLMEIAPSIWEIIDQKDKEIAELRTRIDSMRRGAEASLANKDAAYQALEALFDEETRDHKAAAVEIAELREKVAAQQAAIQLAIAAFTNTAAEYRSGYLSGGSIEISDMRVEAWKSLSACGTEELAAVKESVWQAGYAEGRANGKELVEKARQYGVEEGKQAGRAELEKELMEQDPAYYIASLEHEKVCTPLLSKFKSAYFDFPLYIKPFPQQKPPTE